MDDMTPVGMVAIGIGGVSSALWGSIIAVHLKQHRSKL